MGLGDGTRPSPSSPLLCRSRNYCKGVHKGSLTDVISSVCVLQPNEEFYIREILKINLNSLRSFHFSSELGTSSTFVKGSDYFVQTKLLMISTNY